MSFETNRSGALLWHTSTLFDAGAVCHGFSTRPGGVSPAPWDSLNLGVGRGDTAENVQENFRRFCAAVGADPMRVVLSKQVHEPNGPPCDRGGRGQGPLARARLSECGRDDLQHAEPAARRLFRRLRHHPAARPGARGRRRRSRRVARRGAGAGFHRASPDGRGVRHPSRRRARRHRRGHRPVLLRDGRGCAAGYARRARARRPIRISSSAARSGMSISRASTPTGSARTAWSKSTSARTARPAARICTGPIAGWATRAARRSP